MRNDINENYIYGELKLWKSAKKQNAVGILVEAKADELFYRTFFTKNTAFFKTNGFQKLEATFEEIEKNKDEGVIGIIDADFRRIDYEKLKYKSLFLSDGHDVEMMTINSPAWEQVLDFHIDREKKSNFEKTHNNIKDYLFDIAKSIASVRYLNHKEKIGLVFRTFKKDKPDFIDYQKFVSKDNLSFDFNEMLKTIENKSSKQNFFRDNVEFREKLDNIQKEKYDLSEFCNGHDIINLLALALKKTIGNTSSIKGTDIEKELTIAYRFDDFKKTNLYKMLLNWEQENVDFKLFDN